MKREKTLPSPAKSPRGALLLITVLLITSGLLRLADPETALAAEVATLAARATNSSEASDKTQRETCSNSESTVCAVSVPLI